MEMTYTETLVVTHCWCGVAVAIPENLMAWAKERTANAVFCPLGHTFVFNNSLQKKLDQERARHQATRDLLRAEERSHSATRGQLTKQKRRAAAALCPCCNRSFVNVQRHLASKHPDYVKEALGV